MNYDRQGLRLKKKVFLTWKMKKWAYKLTHKSSLWRTGLQDGSLRCDGNFDFTDLEVGVTSHWKLAKLLKTLEFITIFH